MYVELYKHREYEEMILPETAKPHELHSNLGLLLLRCETFMKWT